MAEEAEGKDGTPEAPAPSGVDSLFADKPAETPDKPAENGKGGEPQIAPGEKDAKADPMAAFKDAEGTVDVDKLFKAYADNKAAFTQKAQALAEAEKKAKGPELPETFKPYVDAFDWDGLKEIAPKAYREGVQSDRDAAEKMMELLHGHGMPQDKAHAFARTWYEHVNAMLPEAKRPEELRKAAVEALPNGTVVQADVQAWLKQREAVEPFPKEQLAVMDAVMQSPHGLAWLWRMSRSAGASAPPGTGEHTAPEKSKESREAEIRKQLRTLPPAKLAAELPRLSKEWKDIYPDAPDIQ